MSSREGAPIGISPFVLESMADNVLPTKCDGVCRRRSADNDHSRCDRSNCSPGSYHRPRARAWRRRWRGWWRRWRWRWRRWRWRSRGWWCWSRGGCNRRGRRSRRRSWQPGGWRRYCQPRWSRSERPLGRRWPRHRTVGTGKPPSLQQSDHASLQAHARQGRSAQRSNPGRRQSRDGTYDAWSNSLADWPTWGA